MRSLVYRAPWCAEVTEVDDPAEPHGTEVVVRIAATGICGTDLAIVAGEYPAVRPPVVIGHESTGEVAAVGDRVHDLEPGTRVFVNPTPHCDVCRMCRTGRPNHCLSKDGSEAGVSADGTNAALYKTDRKLVQPLTGGIGLREAVLAEPLSCALTGVAQVALRPDLNAVVLGAGPMGILYAHALALHGLVGTVAEASPARRALAHRALPSAWPLAESLEEALERSRPDGVDLFVDTTSVLVATAARAVNRGGQVLVVGLRASEATISPSELADRSVRLVGSIDSIGTFGTACSLLERGALPAAEIVTDALPLERWQDAFALLGCDVRSRRLTSEANALKVVLEP